MRFGRPPSLDSRRSVTTYVGPIHPEDSSRSTLPEGPARIEGPRGGGKGLASRARMGQRWAPAGSPHAATSHTSSSAASCCAGRAMAQAEGRHSRADLLSKWPALCMFHLCLVCEFATLQLCMRVMSSSTARLAHHWHCSFLQLALRPSQGADTMRSERSGEAGMEEDM